MGKWCLKNNEETGNTHLASRPRGRRKVGEKQLAVEGTTEHDGDGTECSEVRWCIYRRVCPQLPLSSRGPSGRVL